MRFLEGKFLTLCVACALDMIFTAYLEAVIESHQPEKEGEEGA